MKHLWARGFGKLHRDAEVIVTDDGKRFLLALIEFDERTLSTGKPYAQRIVFRSFHEDDMEIADQLIVGTYVMFDGDCDAVADKSSAGWWYANPRVTGRLQEISHAH